MNIRKIINDIMTGADNESFDNGRVVCLLSFIVYFILAFCNLHAGHPWTAMDFSGGTTAMAVGFGVNLRLKKSTEPMI